MAARHGDGPLNASAGSCAGCGAALPVSLAPVRFVCPYCGREQLIGAPPPVAPPPSPFFQPPYSPSLPLPGTFTPPPGAARAVLVVVALLAVALVVAGSLFATVPGLRPAAHLQWDPGGTASAVVAGDTNGDGVEDFVGRYRMLDDKGKQTLYVGLFDGKTFAQVWTAGPYGTLEQSVNAMHLAVVGGRVVVTDFREQARVLDLKTGKELSAVKMADRATAVCSGADPSRVFVDVAGGQGGVLDTATGAWTAGLRPAWCAHPGHAECAGMMPDGPCGPTISERVSFGALAPRMVLRGGTIDVAIAMKAAGTPASVAVGLDPTTHAVKWRTTLAPDPAVASVSDFSSATLHDGKLVTAYLTTSPDVLHALVLDATTGARLVDRPFSKAIPADQAGDITVSATRAYIPHWVWLEVVDLRAGKVVGTVGRW